MKIEKMNKVVAFVDATTFFREMHDYCFPQRYTVRGFNASEFANFCYDPNEPKECFVFGENEDGKLFHKPYTGFIARPGTMIYNAFDDLDITLSDDIPIMVADNLWQPIIGGNHVHHIILVSKWDGRYHYMVAEEE